MSTRPIVHLCPALRQLDACNWELLEDVHHRMADGREVCVPAGFVFDFASIPQLFWSVVGSPTTLRTCAPLVHDEGYRRGGIYPGTNGHRYTRAQVDREFWLIMRAHGVPGWRARACYTAVRLFGGAAWRGT